MNILTDTSNFTKEFTDFGLQYYCSLAVEHVLVGWHNIDMYMRVGGKNGQTIIQTDRSRWQSSRCEIETNKQTARRNNKITELKRSTMPVVTLPW